MRDILITLIVFGSLPFILRRPFVGVVMWTWLGLMNPHRLAWGFSTHFPFALIVFITTIIALLASREPKRVPLSREIIVLIVLIAWMYITTLNALFPVPAFEQWSKVWRIQLGIILTLMLTTTPERVRLLVWTIAVSLGFYGLKGGIWTIMTGGANRVYGPDGTFLAGNNELGLALNMTIPFLWYLAANEKRRFVRFGFGASVFLTLVAIVGTHSRGALVGVVAMGLMFILKSRQRFVPLLLAGVFVASLPALLPESWWDRMRTLGDSKENQDESVQNRFDAWSFATQIAKSRVTGGGYEVLAYANGVDAHSIYFEMLGEQGFIGLGLFLLLSAFTWLKASRLRKMTRWVPNATWAHDLASMLQASLVAYATSGAFLGLAYFDFFYLIVALTVALHMVVSRAATASSSPFIPVPSRSGAPEPIPGASRNPI
ncbi:MAG TPA: putative O-glycosylation ligase, exosortase A system-associated [Gammaproteobacteria bacterium]|nr:putative O-glycosylation ligase, exosortase A system-associated [Gammaproteobacteria bacterium]